MKKTPRVVLWDEDETICLCCKSSLVPNKIRLTIIDHSRPDSAHLCKDCYQSSFGEAPWQDVSCVITWAQGSFETDFPTGRFEALNEMVKETAETFLEEGRI